MTASGASHSRAALLATASSTGWMSVGELLMTRRISAVAVCCSSDSVSSRLRACSSLKSRTFSIAITAWSAKVLSNAISFSLNGAGLARITRIAPSALPSRSSGAAAAARTPMCSKLCRGASPTQSSAKTSGA